MSNWNFDDLIRVATQLADGFPAESKIRDMVRDSIINAAVQSCQMYAEDDEFRKQIDSYLTRQFP